MITSKRLPAIVAVLLCLCLAFCGFIVYAAGTFDIVRVTEYETKLFGDEIVTLDIQVNRDDWQGLLDGAREKEWISGDLMINGKRFNTVGIRAKGNSTLTQVSKSGGGRYSLQFEANHYVKGQTFYGLDTFCVNNLFDDATYMKEYLAYDIMKFIGVAAPLVNYASVTVNGEDYGFILMLERYDKAFLDRVYGTTSGQLYNVKKEKGQQGGSLLYAGDDISLYAEIFGNAVFKKKSDKHETRVVTAIKNLNAGAGLEEYFGVDEILRYFAAHTVVVNTNSYVPDKRINESQAAQLVNTIAANALIGREKSAVICFMDHNASRPWLRQMMFHEFAHIFCAKSEMDGEHFIELYGSGTTPENPDMTPAERDYDGFLIAGYKVWSEFIAQYFTLVFTEPDDYRMADVRDYVKQFIPDLASNETGKAALSMICAALLSCADAGNARSRSRMLRLLFPDSEDIRLAFRECLALLESQLRNEKPWKITEEYIAGLGAKFLEFKMMNSGFGMFARWM